MNLKKLSSYILLDEEKADLVDSIIHPLMLCAPPFYDTIDEMEMCKEALYEKPLLKYCPKCNRKYPKEENFCFECSVRLKNLTDKVRVCDIKTKPEFDFKGKNSFDSFNDIFTDENLAKINELKFTIEDYSRIIKSIKKTALKTMDGLIKENELFLDELNILDNVMLFAKSFVSVDYKSHGQELGFFEFDKITIDDRQNASLQITTLIHELSHFLLKEILTQIICRVLDCNKNKFIEAIAIFILSYSPFTQLIDEYSAHTVEGRFTLYGYQDYSSFLQIEKSLDGEMEKDEIEITKSIGNTFANSIKDILESFIDDDLRSDIKSQFEMDIHEDPNYDMLALENCNKLSDEGLIKSIWLILTDGFTHAALNVDTLIQYSERLNYEH